MLSHTLKNRGADRAMLMNGPYRFLVEFASKSFPVRTQETLFSHMQRSVIGTADARSQQGLLQNSVRRIPPLGGSIMIMTPLKAYSYCRSTSKSGNASGYFLLKDEMK